MKVVDKISSLIESITLSSNLLSIQEVDELFKVKTILENICWKLNNRKKAIHHFSVHYEGEPFEVLIKKSNEKGTYVAIKCNNLKRTSNAVFEALPFFIFPVKEACETKVQVSYFCGFQIFELTCPYELKVDKLNQFEVFKFGGVVKSG